MMKLKDLIINQNLMLSILNLKPCLLALILVEISIIYLEACKLRYSNFCIFHPYDKNCVFSERACSYEDGVFSLNFDFT